MPEISPLGNPTLDDIERAGRQRLARSDDLRQIGTADARLIFFLNFVEFVGRSHNYLFFEVERIIFCYVTWLLSGNSLPVKNKPGNKFYIKVGTIKSYLGEVNKHYVANDKPKPYDYSIKSRTVRLLEEQTKYEEECARRAPLPDAVIMRLYELACESGDPHCFRTVVWHIVNKGRYLGYRRQEYAMERHDKIDYYLLPSGLRVMRAFAVNDIKFFNSAGLQLSRLPQSRESRDAIEAAGALFKIQKNRQNGQLQRCQRNRRHPKFCFVESAMALVDNALYLGQNWTDPLCVYREGLTTKMLTGHDVTTYLRFVTQSVHPAISQTDLNLISTHSVRVTAAVSLHEAGKDATYIKLRLRWLSDCFLVYLRNTRVILIQHNRALEPAHARMLELALTSMDLPTAPAHVVPVDTSIPDLEDED